MTLHFKGAKHIAKDGMMMIVPTSLFRKNNNVVCIIQINKVLSSHDLNTKVLEVLECSLHDCINNEVEQKWRQRVSLKKATSCRKAFGKLPIY